MKQIALVILMTAIVAGRSNAGDVPIFSVDKTFTLSLFQGSSTDYNHGDIVGFKSPAVGAAAPDSYPISPSNAWVGGQRTNYFDWTTKFGYITSNDGMFAGPDVELTYSGSGTETIGGTGGEGLWFFGFFFATVVSNGGSWYDFSGAATITAMQKITVNSAGATTVLQPGGQFQQNGNYPMLITIAKAPTAVATVNATAIAAGGSVILDGTGSHVNSQSASKISQWDWQIDNLTNSANSHVTTFSPMLTQTLTEPGDYSITLTVTDDLGLVSDSTYPPLTVAAVAVTFNPTSVTVVQGSTATTSATIVPSDAVNSVAFSTDDLTIATVTPTTVSSSPGQLTVSGVASGPAKLQAQISGSGVLCGSEEITVSSSASVTVSPNPANTFIGVPISLTAVGSPAVSDAQYFWTTPDGGTITGSGSTVQFSATTAGTYSVKVQYYIDVNQTATATTKVNVIYVQLDPNPAPDVNPDTSKVSLLVGRTVFNETNPKVLAKVTPWNDDVKGHITFAAVGPNSGNPKISIGTTTPSANAGYNIDVSLLADSTSGTGITNLVASFDGTVCSNTLPIYVWQKNIEAWVEGQKFSDGKGTIDMPKPDAIGANDVQSYTLTFMAQRQNGDYSTGFNYKFTWSVNDSKGFTLKPTTDEGLRSVSKGTIDQSVVKDTVHTVKVVAKPNSPFGTTSTHTQAFIFHAGTITPSRTPVLAGGSDGATDAIHQATLSFAIGGSLALVEMKLESNADYFVQAGKKPSVGQTNGNWTFTSSDKVPGAIVEKGFDVGAYVYVPLISSTEIRVAHATVNQVSGNIDHLDRECPKPPRIYPNGQFELKGTYELDGTLAPNQLQARISDDPATPIAGGMNKSTYSAEFQFVPDPAPTGIGVIDSHIQKTLPTHDDPTNSLYNFVKVVIVDTRVYVEGANGASPSLCQFEFNENIGGTTGGAEESSWRSIYGNHAQGTYWNWATIINPKATGRSFQTGEPDCSSSFGDSLTWHTAKLETDDNVTKLEGLLGPIQSAGNKIGPLQQDWHKATDNLDEAITNYNKYLKGAQAFDTLFGVLKNITEIGNALQNALKDVKTLQDLLDKATDPDTRAKLAKELIEAGKKVLELKKGLQKLVDLYNSIADNISGVLDVTAPGILLERGTTTLREAEKIKSTLQGIRDDELLKLRAACQFVVDLNQIIEFKQKQQTVDPDETVKRKTMKSNGRQDAVVGRAEDLIAEIDDITQQINKLDALVENLNNSRSNAYFSAIVTKLARIANELGKQVLKQIKIPGDIGTFLDTLGVPKSILKTVTDLIKSAADQDAQFQEFINDSKALKQAMDTALDSSVDVFGADKGPYVVKNAPLLYRLWITPTVEFKKEDLLKPALGF